MRCTRFRGMPRATPVLRLFRKCITIICSCRVDNYLYLWHIDRGTKFEVRRRDGPRSMEKAVAIGSYHGGFHLKVKHIIEVKLERATFLKSEHDKP